MASEHQLVEHTFTTLQICYRCNKYLCGFIRQGLQCEGWCYDRQMIVV